MKVPIRLTNKIGLVMDALPLDVREGLLKCKELGAEGVQIHAIRKELDPDNFSSEERKSLRSFIASLGLELSALCGDLGTGLQDKRKNPDAIAKSKRIMDLAVDLGTNIVTTHIGVIPESMKDPIYTEMRKACEELGAYAQTRNAYFAIETGPESAAHLRMFLDSLGTSGVAVNYDPANLVMVTGDDPIEGVRTLKDYIVHVHVKDGVRRRPADPKEIYGYLGSPRSEPFISRIVSGEFYKQMPLGEGQVHFDAFFSVLQEIGYKGFLTIEREGSSNPEEELRAAIHFMQAYR